MDRIDFKALFSTLPNPYVLLDTDFRIVEMNAAYLAVTGRRREDIVGKSMFEAFPSDPASESHRLLRSSLERVRDTGRKDDIGLIRYDIDTPAGRDVRYWSATHLPVLSRDGEFLFILQHTVDVTDLHRLRAADAPGARETGILHRAEEVQRTNLALEGERRYLRALFEQTPGFMAVLRGPEHVFEIANAAYRKLVGHRDVVGLAVTQALPEVEEQGFVAILDKVLETGEPFIGRNMPIMLRETADAPLQQSFLDFIYQPILGADGRPTGIFVQGNDVTEARQAELARAESEDRFRLLAETAPVMLWMSDPQGQCVYLNAAQRAFWGVGADELDAFSWAATVHPEDREAMEIPFTRAMAERTPFLLECRLRRADGAYRVIHTSARPRFDPAGGFLGMIGVNVDLTDLREEIARRAEVEDRLRELNETLEARVESEIAGHRQTELALRQAQKLEAIGKLTGGVAHDFNNLLQVISGNLQLLARDVAGNEKAERRLANALTGVSRGARLASQLLSFGRRQALEPKVVNIGRFVYGMEEMLSRTLGEEIEIETIVSGGLWNTLVDPTQAENALLNLVINARDAMGGSGKLTIEVGNAFLDDAYVRNLPDVTAGQYVMLAVSDTGAGIPGALLEQVFEPFFSTKAEGQGSGLGLSMVYGFVKQSGGHVRIYSEEGQGTAVKLYLPRSTEAEDAVAPVHSGPVTGGSETILVVEDDDSVRATVVEMLSELGYQVLMARDAASALSVVESGARIDLLFTDVVMPGPLKSPALARKARQRLPGLAVLFTSGYTENSIVHGGRLEPGVDLLSKPYTREALAAKLRLVIEGKGAQASLESPVEEAPSPSGSLVLLVEDDPLIRMNAADMLDELGYRVMEAANGEDALALLADKGCDILVADLTLPGISGAELAEEALRRLPGLGVVFATGHSTAPDFSGPRSRLLRKPYDLEEMRLALAEVVHPDHNRAT